ncbi:MAG: lipocalin family protein [archaeon]|nr:hypothetical protein [Nanoarchaeota archaeon]
MTKQISNFYHRLALSGEEWRKKVVKEHNIKLDNIKKKGLSYPKDLYPLWGAPLEWWYFNGHLREIGAKKDLQEFGYEFCFFKYNPWALRFGPVPLSFMKKEPFLIFHFAITDKTNKKFDLYEDSGTKTLSKIYWEKLSLELGNSKMTLGNKNNKKTFQIKTKNDLAELKLDLTPAKRFVKHFDNGFSVMFRLPEFRTYYLSFTRVKSSGYLKIGGKKYQVQGESWFDHQKLNHPPQAPFVGWDWFGIMFDDNTELMVFDIRGEKNLKKDVMGGTYVDKNSKKVDLKAGDFKIKILSKWTNPKTKITYPSGWEIEVPKLNINIKITPIVKGQEISRTITTPVSYWEGACTVEGKKGGKKIIGKSYVELTGYDQRFLARLTQKLS